MEYNALRLECMEGLRRAEGESLLGYCARLEAFLANRETAARSQWTGRRTWSTHTYPGGCWICDLVAISRSMLRELRYYGDMEQEDYQERTRIMSEIREMEEANPVVPDTIDKED